MALQTTRIEINLRTNPFLYTILVHFYHLSCMAIGTDLRAIKPSGSVVLLVTNHAPQTD